MGNANRKKFIFSIDKIPKKGLRDKNLYFFDVLPKGRQT